MYKAGKTLLQINSVVSFGSTGRIIEELGAIAIRNDWNSYIAFGRNHQISTSRIIQIGSNWDIKLHGLQTRLFDRHGLGSISATKKLVNQINNIKPDIIHLHNIHGYYLNIPVLFNYLNSQKIPVVWTFHDCWPMTGHCAHFDLIGCEKWKTNCFSCPQLKKYPASLGIDRSTKNYQLKKSLFTSPQKMTIVPVSQWLGNVVKQSFFKNSTIQVINNGIDTTIFKPCKNELTTFKYKTHNKFVILGVANNWSPTKGLSDFFKLSQMVDIHTMIILVGLTSKQIKELPVNILGISRTENREELAELYSIADVFVNPSVEETFGLTTAEALSCGTPAIVYNATACPEVVSPETGFVVEKGDITGLLNAINVVRKNGKQKYTNACRKRATIMYDKNDRYLDYLQLYESMLNH